MKFLIKAKKANNKGIIHIEISTKYYLIFYRPAIEFNSTTAKFENQRFTEDSENAEALNKRLEKLEKEITRFFDRVIKDTRLEPTEAMVNNFLHCCSPLLPAQRYITLEEFLSWDFIYQIKYYKFNIEGKRVNDWQRHLQNCVENDTPILTNKDLYICGLRIKVEALKQIAIRSEIVFN